MLTVTTNSVIRNDSKKFKYYMSPIDPAVNPIIRKKENSAKSLGSELTLSFI